MALYPSAPRHFVRGPGQHNIDVVVALSAFGVVGGGVVVITVVPHGCKLQYMRDCEPLTGNRIPHKPYNGRHTYALDMCAMCVF